jgi:ATP-dependent helicase/DNAse subunit B
MIPPSQQPFLSMMTPPRPSGLRGSVLQLLPTQVRVRHEVRRHLLARDGPCTAAVGARRVTFPALIDELYRELPDGGQPLGELARTLLADEVIERFLAVPDRYFASQQSFRGFTREFLKLVDDLRRALITPDQYEETLSTNPPLGTDPRQVAELAALYRRYCERLAEQKLVDRPAMEQAVLTLLESRASVDYLRDVDELQMQDIYDLTFVQFRIVLALTQRLRQARVWFPYNPERPDAYRFVGEHTVLYFELLGEERVAERIDPCFKFREQRPGTALSFVLDHIFRPVESKAGLAAVAQDASIDILAAPGLVREVESIGRDIRELLEAGVPQESIGVVFRNLGAYGKVVEDVFTRYHIPFSFRRGSPLLSSPVVGVALTLLDLAAAADNLDRDRLVGFLSSSYVTVAGSDVREFDRRTVRADIRGGSLAQYKAALHHIGCGNDATLAALHTLLDGLGAPRPLPAFTATLRQLMRQLRVRDNVGRTREPAVLARDLEALEQLEAVLADIDEAARLLAGGKAPAAVRLDDFQRILLRGLEGGAMSGHLAHRGGILVLNALDARGLDFDYVFIGGLAEGQWPQPASGSPLFTDAEKSRFRDHAGRRMFRSSRMAAWEDPLLFCLTLSMARKRAVLSYPTADARGNALARSWFVDEVCQLVSITPRVVPSQQIVTPLEAAVDPWELALAVMQRESEVVPTDGILPRQFEFSLYPLLPGASATPLLPSMRQLRRTASIEQQRDAFFREGDAARRAALAFPAVGRLGANASHLRKPLQKWSASDLELYANCPTAFFLKKVLGLRAVDRPDVEAAVNVVATLVHEIMYEFFKRQRDANRWVLGHVRRSRALLDEVLREVFERWESTPEKTSLGLRRRLRGDRDFWTLKREEIEVGLHRALGRVAENWERERHWTPLHFELSFGMDEEPFPQPYMLTLPGGGRVSLVGRIDRLDEGPGGALRILDYKWSSSQAKLEEIRKPATVGDTRFQLMLYLRIAGDMMRSTSSRHGSIFLLRKAMLDERVFENEELDLMKSVGPLIERAQSGVFDTSPRDCPPTCDYRHACRYFVPRTPERSGQA